jgi:hypothetical protein
VYGNCTQLREALEDAGQAYVPRVPSNFRVTVANGITTREIVERVVEAGPGSVSFAGSALAVTFATAITWLNDRREKWLDEPAEAPGLLSQRVEGAEREGVSQMLTLRQTSSVPPKDGVQFQAAFLALRTAATRPELVGSLAALLYALRTLFQMTASAATGGGLRRAAATAVCSLVMSPSRLDDPLPELTATLSI